MTTLESLPNLACFGHHTLKYGAACRSFEFQHSFPKKIKKNKECFSSRTVTLEAPVLIAIMADTTAIVESTVIERLRWQDS
jgi:hypothetical protein